MSWVDGDPEIKQPRWWEYEDSLQAREKERQQLQATSEIVGEHVAAGDFTSARQALADVSGQPETTPEDFASAAKQAVKKAFGSFIAQPQGPSREQLGAPPAPEPLQLPQGITPGQTIGPDTRTPWEREQAQQAFQQEAPDTSFADRVRNNVGLLLSGPGGTAEAAGNIASGVGDYVGRLNQRIAEQSQAGDVGSTTVGEELTRKLMQGGSGNAAIQTLTGKDPNELPGPLPVVTDVAASPLNLLGGADLAAQVPTRALSARVAARAAGEAAAPTLRGAATEYARQTALGTAGMEVASKEGELQKQYAESDLPGADIAGSGVAKVLIPLLTGAAVGGGGLIGERLLENAARNGVGITNEERAALQQIKSIDARYPDLEARIEHIKQNPLTADLDQATTTQLEQLQRLRDEAYGVLTNPGPSGPSLVQRLFGPLLAGQGAARASLTETVPAGTPVFHGTDQAFEGMPSIATTEASKPSITGGYYFFSGKNAGDSASSWAIEDRALAHQAQAQKLPLNQVEPIGARVIPAEAARDLKVLNLDEPITADEAQRLVDSIHLLPDDKATLQRMVDGIAQGKTWLGSDFLSSFKAIARRGPDLEKAGFDGAVLVSTNPKFNGSTGVVLTNAPEQVRSIFEPTTVYHGTGGPLEPGGLRPDSFVTTNRDAAWAFARADARLRGGTPQVYTFEAAPGALAAPPEADFAATAGGAMVVRDPAGLTPVAPTPREDFVDRFLTNYQRPTSAPPSDIARAGTGPKPPPTSRFGEAVDQVIEQNLETGPDGRTVLRNIPGEELPKLMNQANQASGGRTVGYAVGGTAPRLSVDDMRYAIEQGMSGANWYRSFSTWLNDELGGRLTETLNAFAIGSQQSPPAENLIKAFRAMSSVYEITEGGTKPLTFDALSARIGEDAPAFRYLDAQGRMQETQKGNITSSQVKKIVDGYNQGHAATTSAGKAKTPSYWQNLHDAFFGRYSPFVTGDTHHSAAFGLQDFEGYALTKLGWGGEGVAPYDIRAGGRQLTDQQYQFMERLTQQLAAERGLVPSQAQAAMWETIKKVKEADNGAIAEAYSEGKITWQEAVDRSQGYHATGEFEHAFNTDPAVEAAFAHLRSDILTFEPPQYPMSFSFEPKSQTKANTGFEVNTDLGARLREDVSRRSPIVNASTTAGTHEGALELGDHLETLSRMGFDHQSGQFPELTEAGIPHEVYVERAASSEWGLEPNLRMVLPGANDQKTEFVAAWLAKRLDAIGRPQDAMAIELPGSSTVTSNGMTLRHPDGRAWSFDELEKLNDIQMRDPGRFAVGFQQDTHDPTLLAFNDYGGERKDFADRLYNLVSEAGYDPATMEPRAGDSYLVERPAYDQLFQQYRSFYDPGQVLRANGADLESLRAGDTGAGARPAAGGNGGAGERGVPPDAAALAGQSASQQFVDFLTSPAGARLGGGAAGAAGGFATGDGSLEDRFKRAAVWGARGAALGDAAMRLGNLGQEMASANRAITMQVINTQKGRNQAYDVQGAGGTVRHVPAVGDTGIMDAIALKQEALHAPGRLMSILPPVIEKGVGIINPAATQDQEVLVAWRARGGTRASFNSTGHAAMEPYVQGLEQAMQNSPATYLLPKTGARGEALIGTVKDIAERPEAYAIPAPLRQALDAYDNARWDLITSNARQNFGVEVNPYLGDGKPGFVYMPTVGTADSIEQKLEQAFPGQRQEAVTSAARAMSGTRGTKERLWVSAFDRMNNDKTFEPVTDLRELNTLHIQAMAQNAADNVLRHGIASGMTRTQLVEQLHPGLVAEREAVSALADSLAGRLHTAEARVTRYSQAADRAETQLNQQAARFSRLADRVTDRQTTVADRQTAARDLVNETRQALTDTRQQARQAFSEQGRAQVLDVQARRNLGRVLRRADQINGQLQQMDAQIAARSAGAFFDSPERVKEWTDNARTLVAEANQINRQANQLTRKALSLPLGDATAQADAAAEARVTAQEAARTAGTDMRQAEQQAIQAARRQGQSGQDVVLGHLEGRLSELQNRVQAVGREAARHQDAADALSPLVSGLDQALQDVKARKLELDKAYRTADTGGYVYVPQTYQYYPPEAAASLHYLTGQVTGPLKNLIDLGDEIRAFHLAGDASPITIQGMLAVIADPVTGIKATTTWVSNLLKGESPINALNRLARDEAQDVAEYTFATGRQFGRQEAELSAVVGEGRNRGLGRVPGMANLEDQLFGTLQLTQYTQWKHDRDLLLKMNPNMSRNLANAEAANMLSKLVPSLSPSERGISAARAGLERATMTSVSFAASPALVLKDFSQGLVKLGLSRTANPVDAWRTLDGREQLAIYRVLTATSTVGAISTASAAAWAWSRNMDPLDAMKEAWDPNSRYFMSLQLGWGKSIPLGGTFRAAIKAVMPDHNGVIFGNVGGWLSSRFNTPVRLPLDLAKNEDFKGNTIYSGNLFKPENLARALWYGAESSVPLSAGQVMSDVRTGDLSLGNTLTGVAWQFAGTNYTPVSASEKLNQIAREVSFTNSEGKTASVNSFWELPPRQQDQLKKQNPDLWAQYVANASDKKRQAEQVKSETAAQQEGDDKLLLEGKLSAKDWYDAYGSRRDQLTGATNVIYKDDQSGQPTTPDAKLLDTYYQQIEDSKQNGRPDWGKVDAWKATLSASQQRFLDDNTGLGMTPLVTLRKQLSNDYYALRKYPGMSGEQASAVDAAVAKVQGTGREDYQQLRSLNALVEARQIDPQTAALARRVILGLVEPTEDRNRWRQQHPESALLLAQGTLDAKQIAAIEKALQTRK